MATSVIVVKIVQSVAKASLVESIRDGVVDFLVDQAKDLGKGEISKRIEGLRSDAKMRKEIQEAARRAAERWARIYSRGERNRKSGFADQALKGVERIHAFQCSRINDRSQGSISVGAPKGTEATSDFAVNNR